VRSLASKVVHVVLTSKVVHVVLTSKVVHVVLTSKVVHVVLTSKVVHVVHTPKVVHVVLEASSLLNHTTQFKRSLTSKVVHVVLVVVRLGLLIFAQLNVRLHAPLNDLEKQNQSISA